MRVQFRRGLIPGLLLVTMYILQTTFTVHCALQWRDQCTVCTVDTGEYNFYEVSYWAWLLLVTLYVNTKVTT